MPKIIKDIESRMVESAERLFAEKGFEKTEIKEIVRMAGVSVGTLYNYWPSKRDLFEDISRKQWEAAFESLDEILKSGVNSQLKAMLFIKKMYDHFERRLRGRHEESNAEVLIALMNPQAVWDEIQNRLVILFREITKPEAGAFSESDCRRAARAISFSILSCIQDFPHEKQKNIEFIHHMMHCAMKDGRN